MHSRTVDKMSSFVLIPRDRNSQFRLPTMFMTNNTYIF